MTEHQPTVALIHASAASIAPATAAFAEEFPDARLWHLLDDQLVVDADRAGGLTPGLRTRMTTLIQYAVDGGADAVQLSCSMYGPVAVAAEQSILVLASDQAMFDHVVRADVARVAVLGSLESAASDSGDRLRQALAEAGAASKVQSHVVAGAAAAASADDMELLTELMVAAAVEVGADADLVVLAQYSLSPTVSAVAAACPVPVLSPPDLAAATLRGALTGSGA